MVYLAGNHNDSGTAGDPMHLPDANRSINLQIAMAAIMCALLGASFAVQPMFSMAAALCLAVFALLVAARVTLRQLSLGFILAAILGYVFVGRGFAYVGMGQLYIGEILLAVAVVVAATSKRQRRAVLPIVVASGFIIFGLFKTIPFVNEFGLLAIRDAALYYYILSGVLLYFSLSENEVRAGLRLIGEAIPFYLVWSVIQLGNDMAGFFPNIQWPGAPVGFLVTKPGDRAVVLVALAAYTLVGLPKLLNVKYRTPSGIFWTSWIGLAAVAAIGARGGLLAIALGFLVVIAFQRNRELLRMFLIGAAVLTVMLVWNPSIKVGSYRELSVDQFSANLTSIFGSTVDNSGGVDQNRDWRLEFWKATIDDTLQSDQKWFGMGYGKNLASEAGFQINAEADLRSPHNVFVTILARMGIFGLIAWVGLVASISLALHRAYVQSRRLGDETAAAVMIFGLSYMVAVLVNATFDVYLEGPQGALPFWCAIGAILVLAEPRLRHSSQKSS